MQTITVNELKQKLDRDEVLLIDVREPAEYQAESIRDAQLIPLSQISCNLLPTKSKPIVVHCRSGVRSLDACHRLLAQDPSLEVYSLEGGILAWKNAGFAVQTSAEK